MNTVNKARRQVLGGLSALAATGLVGATEHQNTDNSKPNILFIMVDDMGYADLGVYGQTDFDTPNLDKLAKSGIRFTQAYANSAVCSASRCALITGRYQDRLAVGLEEPLYKAGDYKGLPPSHPTLPSLLRDAGYTTALFGKWHLGPLPNFGPLKSGYDKFYGNYGAAVGYFTHKEAPGDSAEDLWEDETRTGKLGYYTDILADKTVEYIATPRTKPFFVSLHFTAPHWPWIGPEDEAVEQGLSSAPAYIHYNGGNLATYGKIVEALDAAVGRVLHALEENGLKEKTIIVFTSDNGGERFSKTWPLSGQKTELLEGGIRVPTIVSWPGHFHKQVSDQVAIHMDWLPTLLDVAGTAPHPDYPSDGISLLPMLNGTTEKVERPVPLYWRYHAVAQAAVRWGKWKYLKVNGNEFLFDIVNDQRERANVRGNGAENAAMFTFLKNKWIDWNGQMLAFGPSGNTANGNNVHNIAPAVQPDHYNYPCPPAPAACPGTPPSAP